MLPILVLLTCTFIYSRKPKLSQESQDYIDRLTKQLEDMEALAKVLKLNTTIKDSGCIDLSRLSCLEDDHPLENKPLKIDQTLVEFMDKQLDVIQHLSDEQILYFQRLFNQQRNEVSKKNKLTYTLTQQTKMTFQVELKEVTDLKFKLRNNQKTPAKIQPSGSKSLDETELKKAIELTTKEKAGFCSVGGNLFDMFNLWRTVLGN